MVMTRPSHQSVVWTVNWILFPLSNDGWPDRELGLTTETVFVVVTMNLIKPTMSPFRTDSCLDKVKNERSKTVIILLFLIFQDYDAQDLSDFEDTILQGVGYDAEGKISRKELTMILLALAKPNEDEQ